MSLLVRLRLSRSGKAPPSMTAHEHEQLRHGYTPAMLVEESRILQVRIFNTIQNNLSTVDFSRVLLDVIPIADEADWQRKQAIAGYVRPESNRSAA